MVRLEPSENRQAVINRFQTPLESEIEPNQFFWVDDAFGATQYQRFFVDGWNQELPTLRAAVQARCAYIVHVENLYMGSCAA